MWSGRFDHARVCAVRCGVAASERSRGAMSPGRCDNPDRCVGSKVLPSLHEGRSQRIRARPLAGSDILGALAGM